VRYQELWQRLVRLGFRLDPHGTRHDFWVSRDESHKAFIPRHRGEIPSATLVSILRELGVNLNDLQGRDR
jgi:hypothetical protein